MNTQTTFSVSDRLATIAAKDIANAQRMIKALEAYVAARQRNARITSRYEWALFEVCNAGIDLVDDGNFMAVRDGLMDDLGCDEDGNPFDDAPSFNPSRVHPDDPCQSKGWL